MPNHKNTNKITVSGILRAGDSLVKQKQNKTHGVLGVGVEWGGWVGGWVGVVLVQADGLVGEARRRMSFLGKRSDNVWGTERMGVGWGGLRTF